MSKTKTAHSGRMKIISTIVYLVLVAALIWIRFPVTIDRIAIDYTGELTISQAQDTHGNFIIEDLSLLYDQGDGYVYEGKVNGKKQTVTNSIQAVQQDDHALLMVYQDGDPTLLTKLNSLIGLKQLRLNLPQEPIQLNEIQFYYGNRLVRTISSQEIQEQFIPHNAELILDGGNLMVEPTGEDAYLEIDAGFGSWFYHLTHTFSFANIAMILVFTILYIVVGHGHTLMNKLQQKLLVP